MLAFNEADSRYLERALELAESSRGRCSPNPMVGAVIVIGAEVVGEGHHAGPGQDHAEVAALRDAARRSADVDLSEATMYVTLEPCCVYGRTPPCVSALLEAGLARVVVGAIDPSPQVDGKGIAALREAGVQVDLAEGDTARRCKRQNDGFRKSVVTGLPFITYKYAMSLDGRTACDGGDSKWISGDKSRLSVHRMRAWMDAVMVGAGTMRADDPTLTAREVPCHRQPLRVVVDPGLSIRAEAALVRTVDQGPVLVVCGLDVPASRLEEARSWGVEVAPIEPDAAGRPRPEAVAAFLAERGVQNVLLEGGATLAGAWWQAGMIDKVVAYVAPKILSGRQVRSPFVGPGCESPADGADLIEIQTETFGEDVCFSGYVREAY